MHAWQLTPNGVWSNWTWTGVMVSRNPAVATGSYQELELFVRGKDDVIRAFQLDRYAKGALFFF